MRALRVRRACGGAVPAACRVVRMQRRGCTCWAKLAVPRTTTTPHHPACLPSCVQCAVGPPEDAVWVGGLGPLDARVSGCFCRTGSGGTAMRRPGWLQPNCTLSSICFAHYERVLPVAMPAISSPRRTRSTLLILSGMHLLVSSCSHAACHQSRQWVLHTRTAHAHSNGCTVNVGRRFNEP